MSSWTAQRVLDAAAAMQILARELSEDLPPPELPGGEVVELVSDERTFRAASAVSVQGWESLEPDQAELTRQLKETLRDLATWSSFRVVAFADGEPVSTGGCVTNAWLCHGGGHVVMHP
jgi:hypothetical protein